MGERGGRHETRAVAAVVLGSVACAVAAWGLVAMQAGCQLQGQCDPSTVTVGNGSGTGKQPFEPGAGIYGSTWESSSIDGTWMPLPQERTYIIYPKRQDGSPLIGPYIPVATMISPDPSPNTTGGSNFAPSAGNTTEFWQPTTSADGGPPDYFQVSNVTCSPYYLWLQIAQEASDASAPDASTPDSAPTADAGGE